MTHNGLTEIARDYSGDQRVVTWDLLYTNDERQRSESSSLLASFSKVNPGILIYRIIYLLCTLYVPLRAPRIPLNGLRAHMRGPCFWP